MSTAGEVDEKSVCKVMNISFISVFILSSILLILGAVYKIVWFVIQYLVATLAFMLPALVAFIYILVQIFDKNEVLLGVVTIIVAISGLVVYVYLWLVTFSYYRSIKDDEDQKFKV